MHYRSLMHGVLAILGMCTVLSQSAVAGTRLGLHVTQEELNIWRQRMTDTVNGVNGYSFQSIYQNRLLANANGFRSQSHPGADGSWVGWTGAGCAPEVDPPGSGQRVAPGRGNGADLLRTAYVFLLTGDSSYANPIRVELLNQVAQSGTDWANTSKWCYTSITGIQIFETTGWIMRLATAFDYLNVGGYTGFTPTEKTNITTWIHNAATFWNQATAFDLSSYSSYRGIFQTPQDLTCTGCPGTRMNDAWFNGPPIYDTTGNTFFGQVVAGFALSMTGGVLTNDAALLHDAVAYFTAHIKAGTHDTGAWRDFNRWADCTPGCPGSMWSHAGGDQGGLIWIADLYARTGNTSLYDLLAPTQWVGGNGGTVGLRTTLKLLADMANKTVSHYGTTDVSQQTNSTLLSWDTEPSGSGGDYWDFSSMAANLYYNDPAIHTAMTRTLLAGNTSSSCRDAQFGGCFVGIFGAWPDLPFMYGNMEGQVNPYGATIPPGGTIPQSSLTIQSVDSQEVGYEAVNVIDGNISTIWHTQFINGDPPPPHTIVLNLNNTYSVTGIRYSPEPSQINGTIKNYEVYTSTDNITYTLASSGTFASDQTPKDVTFAARSAKYVKLVELSEINNNPWASAGEIQVYGTQVTNAPSLRLRLAR